MTVTFLTGDVLERLAGIPDDSIDCVITSPPYWGLRDYGVAGQLGMEATLGEHIEAIVAVCREIRRVLKPEGTFWLNYGDCYATKPNGRSAADTKAAGNDDRSFCDKPFSTVQGVLKPKDLCMMPNRIAIALQEDGWWVRSEIVWGKPNPMPDSSGKYRPSTAHEKIFLLSKTGTIHYDHEAVALKVSGTAHSRVAKMPDGWDTGKGAHGSYHRQGREKGKRPGVTPKTVPDGGKVRANESFHASTTALVDTRYLRNFEPAPVQTWTIPSRAFKEAHFATFPPELVERCIKAGCPEGGMVLDPFGGAGTTGLVADRLGRDATLIELNPDYVEIARSRIYNDAPLLTAVVTT